MATTRFPSEHTVDSSAGNDVVQDARTPSPSAVDATPPLFRFWVSRDEEHVRLRIESAGRVFELGERIHHYACLLLVRQAMADARAGLDPASAGWINCVDLAKMLGLDRSHLNVQMFRLLRQIVDSGLPPAQASTLLERRRGQLRVVGIAISIEQGAHVAFEVLSTGVRPTN